MEQKCIDEILPCPFCGSIPEIYWCDMAGGYYIECTKCNCTMTCTNDNGWVEDEAIAAWNRRVPEPIAKPKPLTLDELQGMDGDPVFLIAKDWNAWVLVNSGLEFVRSAHCGEMPFSEYGKTWLAYEREVKGDGNNGTEKD